MKSEVLFKIEKGATKAESREEELSASGQRSDIIVHPGDSSLFMRRAIKKAGTPDAYEVCWLVAELNGVRCFINDDGERVTILLSERDLKP